jgi:Septin family protein
MLMLTVLRSGCRRVGIGKTTFINTLFSTTIKNYADHKRRHQKQVDRTVEIEITKAELEEKFFKGATRYSRVGGGVSTANELSIF